MTELQEINLEDCTEAKLRRFLSDVLAFGHDAIPKILGAFNQCACPSQATRNPKNWKRKGLSAWNCYLKACSQEPSYTFKQCMQDTGRKERVYRGHEAEWKERAKRFNAGDEGACGGGQHGAQ